jgi:hypothetical protein
VDSRATIRLSRQRFGVLGQLAALDTPQIALEAGLSTGLVLFPRSTGSTVASVEPTPSALNPTFYAGLDLRARWSPPWLGRFFGAWIAASADIVPRAPTLGYDVAGSFLPSRALWRVQPGGAIGFFVRAP